MSEEQPLDPSLFGTDHQCFGCGPEHPIGFRLKPFRAGDEVVARITPHEHFQGPLGIMHGGLVTTLADEIAAWTVIGLRERFGFTGSIEARLLRPVRVGQEVEARGKIVADSGRTLKIQVTLRQNGEDAYRGEFSFVVLSATAAEKLLGRPLPDAWKRFARDA